MRPTKPDPLQVVYVPSRRAYRRMKTHDFVTATDGRRLPIWYISTGILTRAERENIRIDQEKWEALALEYLDWHDQWYAWSAWKAAI